MKHLESKLRLASGIVLAVYLAQHLINHAFGIASIEAAEAYRTSIALVFQVPPSQILLYGSFLLHALIALKTVYLKTSLRMPLWQWLQLAMGLAILPLLAGHVIGTRGMDLVAGIDPDYYYVVTAMLLSPVDFIKLAVLMLIVWVHMAIGLHYWLRLKRGYSKSVAYWYAAALLIPTLSAVGVISMYRGGISWIDNADRVGEIMSPLYAMDPSLLETMRGLGSTVLVAMALILVAVLVARQLRLWFQLRRGTYTITHNSGRELRAQVGQSLLEALRIGRIPHASVCGGRGRCTTCRVRVGAGLHALQAPNDLEAKALVRIAAGADVRLACQMYPSANIAVTPLVLAQQPLDGTLHAGGVQGHEEYAVAMFVDMRGSTSMGERVLAYDVVFILNRFFTELSLALEETHGHYAQFAGDGLMALYGINAQRKSRACRDALHGARAMYQRLARLNVQLQAEFGERIQLGVGIHGGQAIVGTMGPPKTPLLTAVGDNINIAARLESQSKTLACDVVVSVETLTAENIAYPVNNVCEVAVRGRNENVTVCTLSEEELLALVIS
jgi:adenylate cyclase